MCVCEREKDKEREREIASGRERERERTRERARREKERDRERQRGKDWGRALFDVGRVLVARAPPPTRALRPARPRLDGRILQKKSFNLNLSD